MLNLWLAQYIYVRLRPIGLIQRFLSLNSILDCPRAVARYNSWFKYRITRVLIVSQVEIYHNPRCSKSRQTLEILQQQGIEATIIEYLKQPPSREQIKAILKALDMTAHQLLRVKEAEYQEYNLSADTTEEDIISAMIAAPKLIERPIVIKAGKARIGRPPESVLEIL